MPASDHRVVQVEEAQWAQLQEISIDTFVETFAPYNDAENMQSYLESAYHPDKLRSEIRHPESRFFFLYADDDSRPAGYLKINTGEAQSEPKGEQRLEIERIYIRSAHKRKGLGTVLYTVAEHWARISHKRYIWLGVWERNAAAAAFYRALGFHEVGEHTFLVGDDPQRDVLMEKEIQ
ncbi:GNAT family N-acetyltransferase [Corynebacterium sp. zg-331]|uniref:GNAT family N-acetyltransferase n=1 Tax=unclassified Corynebacterium TaxID=2624378 RepID=UPI00128E3530|nr:MULTISPECIES: GNAT family N-acetyltransferase [unclassified Corynebacterium]MBC3185173.1 GNAT family N-acetyltransferase [Corynebacterium sp. zg-331]MPV51671.1 GNAT family N-acetyltransferase [Corynebacterium sp. zg331]